MPGVSKAHQPKQTCRYHSTSYDEEERRHPTQKTCNSKGCLIELQSITGGGARLSWTTIQYFETGHIAAVLVA
jgi:hypothetical protein